jgi:hypothetical protein
MKRLYIVVRDDLPPGLMLAQACHAAFEYGMFGGDDVGDNLIVLSASKGKLKELVAQAVALGLSFQDFREPDLGNELTACAFSGSARPLLACLPLALRPPKGLRFVGREPAPSIA